MSLCPIQPLRGTANLAELSNRIQKQHLRQEVSAPFDPGRFFTEASSSTSDHISGSAWTDLEGLDFLIAAHHGFNNPSGLVPSLGGFTVSDSSFSSRACRSTLTTVSECGLCLRGLCLTGRGRRETLHIGTFPERSDIRSTAEVGQREPKLFVFRDAGSRAPRSGPVNEDEEDLPGKHWRGHSCPKPGAGALLMRCPRALQRLLAATVMTL